MVFSCFENESLRQDGEANECYQLKLQKHLLNFVHSTPLNIFVWTLRELGLDNSCKKFLALYENFLSTINDESIRNHLGTLREEDVYADGTFLECRRISHELQAVLTHAFFVADTPLRKFTFEYGVF